MHQSLDKRLSLVQENPPGAGLRGLVTLKRTHGVRSQNLKFHNDPKITKQDKDSWEFASPVSIDVTAGWAASPDDTRPLGPYLFLLLYYCSTKRIFTNILYSVFLCVHCKNYRTIGISVVLVRKSTFFCLRMETFTINKLNFCAKSFMINFP